MADSNIQEINDSSSLPLSKPPVHCQNRTDAKPADQQNAVEAKPVRRVCFSELPLRHKKQPRKNLERSDCGPGCCMCCAWTCMVILALFLTLLLIGALFLFFLRSEMPETRLQKMSFPKLDIVPSSSSTQKKLLSATVNLTIEMSNKNKKVGLSYGTMSVNVWSEKIKLGQTEVAGFSQDPKNVKVIKLLTSVTKSEVDKEEGALLITNFKKKEMVLDVVSYGTVGFNVGALKLNGLPIMVECMKIKQSMVDLGQGPKCSFKLLATRTLIKAMGGGF